MSKPVFIQTTLEGINGMMQEGYSNYLLPLDWNERLALLVATLNFKLQTSVHAGSTPGVSLFENVC